MVAALVEQAARLASGNSTSLALLWDIVQSIRRCEESSGESADAALGAIVPIGTPDGDAAERANGDTAEKANGDANVHVDVEALDVVDAPRAKAEAQAPPKETAMLSSLFQVSSAAVRLELLETSCLSS